MMMYLSKTARIFSSCDWSVSTSRRLSPIVGVQIAQDVSLRIEQESVHAVSRREIADIVGDHAVQPAHPVAAGERNLGAGAEFVNPSGRYQRLEFGADVAKIGGWRNRGRVQRVLLCGHAHFLLL